MIILYVELRRCCIKMRLKERIGSYTLIFDAFSVLTAKKTGAKIHWGMDNPVERTKWGLKAHLFPFAKKVYKFLKTIFNDIIFLNNKI